MSTGTTTEDQMKGKGKGKWGLSFILICYFNYFCIYGGWGRRYSMGIKDEAIFRYLPTKLAKFWSISIDWQQLLYLKSSKRLIIKEGNKK